MRRLALVTVLAPVAMLALGGCVPSAYDPPPADPADLGAEEAALPSVATALTEDPAPLRAAGGGHHGHHGHSMSDAPMDESMPATHDAPMGESEPAPAAPPPADDPAAIPTNPHAGHGQ